MSRDNESIFYKTVQTDIQQYLFWNKLEHIGCVLKAPQHGIITTPVQHSLGLLLFHSIEYKHRTILTILTTNPLKMAKELALGSVITMDTSYTLLILIKEKL